MRIAISVFLYLSKYVLPTTNPDKVIDPSATPQALGCVGVPKLNITAPGSAKLVLTLLDTHPELVIRILV
jgi:hypothetical protein